MATNSKFSADLGLKTDADLQVDGNVTVSGNLTVNGTSTTVNSTTTSVEDSMLELANQNTSSDILDIGIYGNYDDGLGDGTSEYTGLFRDATDSTWKLFDGLEVEPTTTVNTSGSGYTLADLQVGDLTATTLTATNSLTGSSITYPTSDGTNGQVLKTNGSGVLSFGDIPAGYTDSDARSAISVSGNLAYDSSTGVISYTEPTMYTDSDARGAISGGTGISYDSSTGVITSTVSSDGITASGSNTIIQSPDDTNVIHVNNNAKVGVGTANPTKGKIEISGASYDEGLLIERTDTSSRWGLSGNDSGSFQIWDDNQGDSTRLVINSSGDVGIGQISPNARLDVKGPYASPQALIGYSDGDGLFIHAQGGSTHTNWCIGQQKNLSGLEFTPSTTAGGTTFSNPALAIYPNGDVGVGAGTPSFSTFGSSGGGLEIDDVGSSFSALRVNHGSGDAYLAVNAGATYLWQYSNSPIVFGTNNSEYERVDEGGTKFHMTTSGYGTPQYARHWIQFASGSQRGFAFKATSTTSTDTPMIFFNGGAGVAGSITYDYNGTSYNTTSDYRLKENVSDTWDATTRLKQLRPVRFNWIADDTDTLIDGFLAHEVADVVPNAVTGDKDAIEPQVLYTETDYDVINGTANVGEVKDAERIEPQTLDNSKLVPLLVKTIQELEARITALESA
jgi:hypothetical protein